MSYVKDEYIVKTYDRLFNIVMSPDIININSIVELDRNFSPINTQALFKHGTIEFRAHSGTVDAQDIASWIKFINELLQLSHEMVDKTQEAHMTIEMQQFLKGEATEFSPESELGRMQKIFSEFLENNSCAIGGRKKITPPKMTQHPQIEKQPLVNHL